jgi:hypothetical protein
MAKSVRGAVPPIGQEAQEEMTVMVLRLKGGGDTLRKGFDALNHALAALGAPAPLPPQRHTAALPPQIVSPHRRAAASVIGLFKKSADFREVAV